MSLNVHAYVCMCREVLINTYTYRHLHIKDSRGKYAG